MGLEEKRVVMEEENRGSTVVTSVVGLALVVGRENPPEAVWKKMLGRGREDVVERGEEEEDGRGVTVDGVEGSTVEERREETLTGGKEGLRVILGM